MLKKELHGFDLPAVAITYMPTAPCRSRDRFARLAPAKFQRPRMGCPNALRPPKSCNKALLLQQKERFCIESLVRISDILRDSNFRPANAGRRRPHVCGKINPASCNECSTRIVIYIAACCFQETEVITPPSQGRSRTPGHRCA